MRIRRYGIQLRSISRQDLELVRNWRNSPRIKSTMEFQEEITPEMQQKWFISLKSGIDFYWMIEFSGECFGVANLKDTDFDAENAQAGIFMGRQDAPESLTGALATLLIMDFAREILGLKFLKAKVSKQNPKAVAFNKSLGYQEKSESASGFLWMEVDLEIHQELWKQRKLSFRKYGEGGGEIEISERVLQRFISRIHPESQFILKVQK